MAAAVVVNVTSERITLMCACCTLPFGYVQNGVLMIVSKHGGDKHTNMITLEELRRLLERTASTT